MTNKRLALGLAAWSLMIVSLVGASEPIKNISPVYVDTAPSMNGTLEDPVWKNASEIGDFLQQDPSEGSPPSYNTEIRVLYTANTIYFGIICHDAEPDKILAKQLVRDATQDGDDTFTIIIDPTGGGQSGYFFTVNPLGTQRDGIVEGEGINIDDHWDGIWYSEARRSNSGWTAEVAIPFSTLNLSSQEKKPWRINFQRIIRRNQEVDLWAAHERYYGLYKLSKAGTLEGLSKIKAERFQEFKPYFLGGINRNVPSSYNPFASGGFDYARGVTDNFVARITYNTDFSENVPDSQQINFNPFPLFIPETRPFFLERKDIFDFGSLGFDQLFYSRNIGIDSATGASLPILGGVKGVGSLGNTDVGFLGIREQSSQGIPRSQFAIERVKQKFESGSYVGMMAIQKGSDNNSDAFNNSYGADFNLNFFDSFFNLNGFYAKTDSPGRYGQNWSAFLDAIYRDESLYFEVDRHISEPNYNPEVGFVEFPNDNSIFADAVYTLRPSIRNVQRIVVENLFVHNQDTSGVLQNEQLFNRARIVFSNGSYLELRPWNQRTERVIGPFSSIPILPVAPGLYSFLERNVEYQSDPTAKVSTDVQYQTGDYFGGKQTEYSYRVDYRCSTHLSLFYFRDRSDFVFPSVRAPVILMGTGFNYAYSRFVNLNTFIQNNSIAPNATSVNVRFDYRFRPDSDLYLIYNLGPLFISNLTGNSQTLQNQRFGLKVTYAFF